MRPTMRTLTLSGGVLPDRCGGRMRLHGRRAAAVSRGAAGTARPALRAARADCAAPPAPVSRRAPGRRHAGPEALWTHRARWPWPPRWISGACATGAAAAIPPASTAAASCSTCSRGRASRCPVTCGGSTRWATRSTTDELRPGDLLVLQHRVGRGLARGHRHGRPDPSSTPRTPEASCASSGCPRPTGRSRLLGARRIE